MEKLWTMVADALLSLGFGCLLEEGIAPGLPLDGWLSWLWEVGRMLGLGLCRRWDAREWDWLKMPEWMHVWKQAGFG